MSSFKEMMRRARADAEEGDWAPAPGTHKAIVVEGDAFESKMGDPYAKTVLRLVAPGDPNDGRTWDHLMSFRTPEAAQMSASQLSLYGLPGEVLDDLDDIGELADAMEGLAGVEVEVSCKSRENGDGVWTNVTSSRPRNGKPEVPADQLGLDVGKPPATPARTYAADDDDVPF